MKLGTITQNEDFPLDRQIETLQEMFRNSVCGGPTVYTLWRTAAEKGIPTFYLWDQGLVQYGYGKKQIRGAATTFDCDSHLDSDFTTRKDDCKAFLGTLGFPVPKGDIVTAGEQDIASHFRLTCLGIDAIAETLSKSWKDGNFSILEINAAPGISMHLRPAAGESVDVGSNILETFFKSGAEARIPAVTFNRISVKELQEAIDRILLQRPDWTVGAVCREAVFVNRSEKLPHKDYNTNVQNLLRNPKLDLLIAECGETVL